MATLQPARPALTTTIADLPHELIMHILSRLPTTSRARMACTASYFGTLCSDPSVWADIEVWTSAPNQEPVVRRRRVILSLSFALTHL